MPVVVLFRIPGMDVTQYERMMQDLVGVGAGSPNGRLYHIAANSQEGWQIVDVWASPEQLNQFAAVLMPVLLKNGIIPPTPNITPIHNIVQ